MGQGGEGRFVRMEQDASGKYNNYDDGEATLRGEEAKRAGRSR